MLYCVSYHSKIGVSIFVLRPLYVKHKNFVKLDYTAILFCIVIQDYKLNV